MRMRCEHGGEPPEPLLLCRGPGQLVLRSSDGALHVHLPQVQVVAAQLQRLIVRVDEEKLDTVSVRAAREQRSDAAL